jgi:uncharacterized protein YfaA (DUF2138 family)
VRAGVAAPHAADMMAESDQSATSPTTPTSVAALVEREKKDAVLAVKDPVFRNAGRSPYAAAAQGRGRAVRTGTHSNGVF